MAVPQSERGAAKDELEIRAADVIDALARRNPNASKARVASTAQLMALIGEAAQRQESRSQRGQNVSSALLAVQEVFELALSLLEIATSLSGPPGGTNPSHDEDARLNAAPRRHMLVPRGPVEILQGKGLGERISLAEGRRRLAAYATPLALEDWAGPLAGPTELSERLGIARSTLQDWRRDGAVIGLLKGKRKHVFPLPQFVDGRPVRGLAEVVAIVGNPRTAWLWLVEPDLNDGSYLADLKRGRIEAVLEAAREDFA